MEFVKKYKSLPPISLNLPPYLTIFNLTPLADLEITSKSSIKPKQKNKTCIFNISCSAISENLSVFLLEYIILSFCYSVLD